MKIWTLKSQLVGKGDILNGKLFYIKKDHHESAVFIDLETQMEIWVTTPIVDIKIDGNCKILTTRSGSTYEVVEVTSLIPTKAVMEINTPIENHKDSITVIDKKHTSRLINYCDGFDKSEFTFNRNITEEEFTAWLLENSYKIHTAEGWWDQYSKITGDGNKWTHSWIDPYKD